MGNDITENSGISPLKEYEDTLPDTHDSIADKTTTDFVSFLPNTSETSADDKISHDVLFPDSGLRGSILDEIETDVIIEEEKKEVFLELHESDCGKVKSDVESSQSGKGSNDLPAESKDPAHLDGSSCSNTDDMSVNDQSCSTEGNKDVSPQDPNADKVNNTDSFSNYTEKQVFMESDSTPVTIIKRIIDLGEVTANDSSGNEKHSDGEGNKHVVIETNESQRNYETLSMLTDKDNTDSDLDLHKRSEVEVLTDDVAEEAPLVKTLDQDVRDDVNAKLTETDSEKPVKIKRERKHIEWMFFTRGDRKSFKVVPENDVSSEPLNQTSFSSTDPVKEESHSNGCQCNILGISLSGVG